jgi:chromate transport protein ChrA
MGVTVGRLVEPAVHEASPVLAVCGVGPGPEVVGVEVVVGLETGRLPGPTTGMV